MASELLKNRALMQRLKEPDIPQVDFSLQSTGFEELITLPEPKPPELLDIQEDNRKGRLLESLNKIGGRLEDTSLDFINRNEMAIGGGLFSGTDLGTREGFAGIRYNKKSLGGEGNEYIKTFETKGGEKRYFLEFSRGGVNRKFTAPFTPEGLKKVKQKRKEVIEEFESKGLTEKSIKKLKNPPNPNKPWRYRQSVRGNQSIYKYFATEAEAKAAQNKVLEGREEARFKPITKDEKNIIKGEFKKNPNMAKVARDTGISVKRVEKAVDELGLELPESYLNKQNNLDYVKKNYGKKARTTMAKELFPDLPLSTSDPRVGNIVSKLADEKQIRLVPSAMVEEVREKYGFNPDEQKKKVQEERVKAIKKFSVKGFEDKMQGTKAIQKSHMDDLYSQLVTSETLGYSPQKINQQILVGVDPYLNTLYKKREKLLKNKPKGYEKLVEEINQKGMDVAAATKGYKSFNVMQPDGSSYQYGVDASKTIDPTGQLEGKSLQELAGDNKNFKGKKVLEEMIPDPEKKFLFEQNKKYVMQAQAKVTNKQMTEIAKQLESFGFKCNLANGTSCNNPMAYLDDIKKQQTLAKGSGNAAANAVKKLSAGKTIMREFIGPAALGFELAAAIPITYLGYKAGLPPARIVADATYGLFGDTEKARLKKEAVKAGIDTTEIQKSLDFEKASGAMQTLAQQEDEFRGPDDEMLFPQQYEKGEEDFYKAVGAFRDKAGNISKDVYKKFGSQLQQLRDYIAQTDADTAAERSSRVANFGIGDYIDFNSGGRVNYSNGSDGTALAIEESLEAFQRYLKAGGKLGYKDFIALGNEGVSKFFNAGGRVGFADGPDNPKRRTFIKVMAGIASLPILGKFFKGAKTAKVVKLANTTTNMPDWFPAFVDNAFAKGIGKKIDADITELEIPELPGVKVQAHDDGRIMVEGKNAYGEPYEINYTPPGYEVVDEATGKTVKTPGEFEANDTVYYRTGDPREIDYDVDYTSVKNVDDILGGNSTELEGFAKGTKETKITKGQRAVDEADGRLDVDEGPDIDLSDYDND